MAEQVKTLECHRTCVRPGCAPFWQRGCWAWAPASPPRRTLLAGSQPCVGSLFPHIIRPAGLAPAEKAISSGLSLNIRNLLSPRRCSPAPPQGHNPGRPQEQGLRKRHKRRQKNRRSARILQPSHPAGAQAGFTDSSAALWAQLSPTGAHCQFGDDPV